MNKYIILFSIGFLIICSGYCYWKGYNNAQMYYINELNKSHINNLKTITNLMVEIDSKEKQIVSKYLAEIEQLKEEQTNEIESIKSSNLSNTTECLSDKDRVSTRVQTKDENRPNTICYTESELLRKIKESMAIAGDCDQLAMKYNTLLEVCNER